MTFQIKEETKQGALHLPELHCAITGKLISPRRQYRFPTASMGAISNAKIVPESGYLITQNKRIVCSPHINTRYLADVLAPNKILKAAEKEASVVVERGLYLLGPWHRNYYHWLIDYCPQLRIFERYLESIDEKPEPILVYPKGLPVAYEEVLNILWAKQKRFAWCGETVVIKKALVSLPHKGVSFPRVIEGSPPSPESVIWLQRRVFPHLSQQGSRRLLISRQKARSRRIANEEELASRLAKHEFERVHLEATAFLEQAEMFFNAEMVIGCHGAGLANIVFCRHSTRIIEIYPEGTNRTDYHSICRVMGLQYFGVLAKAEDRENGEGRIDADCDGIENLVARLLTEMR